MKDIRYVFLMLFVLMYVGCDSDGQNPTKLGEVFEDQRFMTGEESLVYENTLDCMEDIFDIVCAEPFDPPTVRITEAEIIRCRNVRNVQGCLVNGFELVIEPEVINTDFKAGNYIVLIHLFHHLISGVCTGDFDYNHQTVIWNNRCGASNNPEEPIVD